MAQLKSAFKKGSFQNSSLMANEIMKSQLSGFDQRLRPAEQISSVNTSTRAELLSLMKLRHQSHFQLYKAVRNLALIFNQKSALQLEHDLSPSFNSALVRSEVYTLCAEVNKLVRADLSPFAKELSISKYKVASLNSVRVLNKKPEDVFAQGLAYIEMLKPACEKVEDSLKQRLVTDSYFDGGDAVQARKWFQTITQYTLPIDLLGSTAAGATSTVVQNDREFYLRVKDDVICLSPIDCTRNIMENLVHLYQVALHKGVSTNTSTNELISENHLGGDVACGLFDPWQQSQLRKKNLVSDIVSAAVSGVTLLPVYLDLDFQTKNLVSFSQLYEDGKIKFDPKFDDKEIRSTVFLDLGQLAKAPCYLSVSNSTQVKAPGQALVFQGITFQGCIRNASGQMVSNNLEILSNQSQELAACGAWTLNFESVASAAITQTSGAFRFGLRFVAGLVTYFKESENPISQPIELSVNPEYVKEAYLKYKSIPDSCMYELVNGSKCMDNICLSYTISQVEKNWKVKVVDGSLWNSSDDTSNSLSQNYTDAWLKVDGCEKEIRVPINCFEGKKPSYVGLSKSAPKCARRSL
jgi:hypothetical protein